MHPGYAFDLPDDLDRVRTDIALLELDRAIPSNQVVPIPARGRAAEGDLVQVVSYGRDREDHASLENGCAVENRRWRDAGAEFAMWCPGLRGRPSS